MVFHFKRAEECMVAMSCLSGRMLACKMKAFPLLHVSHSWVAECHLTKQLKNDHVARNTPLANPLKGENY